MLAWEQGEKREIRRETVLQTPCCVEMPSYFFSETSAPQAAAPPVLRQVYVSPPHHFWP